jgi:hypothetical protein
VAFDSSGNVVVTGHFSYTADFGGGSLSSAGGDDIFVAKYASDGTHQWSKRFGDAVDQDAMAVAVDSSGNIVITGFYKGTLDFGSGPLINTYFVQPDIFVAKLNSSGTSVWSKSFGSTSSDQGRAVAVDTSGNVVITGFFTGTVDFGGGALTSNGMNGFIAKYSAAGVHQWSKVLTGTSSNMGLGVAADRDGNVGVTGQFQGTVNLGSGSLTSVGGLDGFLYKQGP